MNMKLRSKFIIGYTIIVSVIMAVDALWQWTIGDILPGNLHLLASVPLLVVLSLMIEDYKP